MRHEKRDPNGAAHARVDNDTDSQLKILWKPELQGQGIRVIINDTKDTGNAQTQGGQK